MVEEGTSQNGRTVFRRKLSPVDFERMNLPEEFWRTKIFQVAESVRSKVEGFLVNLDANVKNGRGLIVSGETGVGKTAIASLILKEARSRGFPSFFITLWDLREAIRNRVPFDEEASIQDRCLDVDVLVLDGLRKEDAKETIFGPRALEEMVMARRSRMKMTVLTTRLGMSELGESFNSLMESTKASHVLLSVEGPDLREVQSQNLEGQAFGVGTG